MLTEDAERLVIRPDGEAYWRWAGASPLIALLALGAGSLRLALNHQVVPMYVLWAFAAVAVVSMWSYFHSARIEQRNDHILRVGLYGLRKHVKKRRHAWCCVPSCARCPRDALSGICDLLR